MTDIDVPDWVLSAAREAFGKSYYDEGNTENVAMRAAIGAALSAWAKDRGVTYFDTRDSSLPTQVDWNHPEPGAKENVYTLRQEKPE